MDPRNTTKGPKVENEYCYKTLANQKQVNTITRHVKGKALPSSGNYIRTDSATYYAICNEGSEVEAGKGEYTDKNCTMANAKGEGKYNIVTYEEGSDSRKSRVPQHG